MGWWIGHDALQVRMFDRFLLESIWIGHCGRLHLVFLTETFVRMTEAKTSQIPKNVPQS